MRFIVFATCLVLLVACSREEHAARLDTVRVDSSTSRSDSVRPASDKTPMQREIPWQRRSELTGSSYEHSIEHGYIGLFRGQKLYYEHWSVYHNAGTSCDYMLLRTDTVWNDTFDICLPQAYEGSQRDTVLIEKWDTTDSYRPAPGLPARDVPSVFQVLRYGDYGYQNYSGLNQDKEQRIYIKGNSLYIQHWDSPRYDDATLELERYDYSETQKKFVYKSTKVLKTEPWQ
jgi:hypothetical protein